MEMLERYLSAIEFWLPAENRNDILAEIREDIASEIEDRQAKLGRALNDAEMEALLKQRGRPMVVANRYRPQQSLIGPVWFPTYVFVLKIVGLCYVLPWLVVTAAVHRFQHSGENWGETMAVAVGTAWTVAFYSAAVVTLVFAILERSRVKRGYLESWNPSELPPVRDAFSIPRSNSVAEIVVGVVFAIWWLGYASVASIGVAPGFLVELAPVRVYFFWGYLMIDLVNIALAAVNLWHPRWTNAAAAGRLLSDLAGGLMFCWLLQADLLVRVVIGNVDSAQNPALLIGIHQYLGWGFPIAVIITVVILIVDLARLVRLNRRVAPRLNGGVTA
jgi:hypothetical protein